MAFVSSALPACAQGPLDALYFYVYGCEVPAGTVTALAAEVGAGFLYASDKSLTFTVPSSNASLLLANAYALELSYEGDSADCARDRERALTKTGSTACEVVSSPTSCADNATVAFSCGDYWTCSGCVLDDFFTAYSFTSGVFKASPAAVAAAAAAASGTKAATNTVAADDAAYRRWGAVIAPSGGNPQGR